MCSTVGPQRAAVERFMAFATSPQARDALNDAGGLTNGQSAKAVRAT
jgi:hypothetical protein